MRIGRRIGSTVATIGVIASLADAAHAEALRIGYLIWVGNGPFFVAQEKGFFAEEGLEVELIDMAVHEALYAGLFAGQVDVISVTVDDMMPNRPRGPLRVRDGARRRPRRQRHPFHQRHPVDCRSRG